MRHPIKVTKILSVLIHNLMSLLQRRLEKAKLKGSGVPSLLASPYSQAGPRRSVSPYIALILLQVLVIRLFTYNALGGIWLGHKHCILI